MNSLWIFIKRLINILCHTPSIYQNHSDIYYFKFIYKSKILMAYKLNTLMYTYKHG